MIEQLEQSSDNTLGYKVSGTVVKDDYEVLTRAEFHWEKVSAWGADMKFGHDYHKKITRMAIVGDKKWQKWVTQLAAPFYAGEAQYFDAEDTESAWAWARNA